MKVAGRLAAALVVLVACQKSEPSFEDQRQEAYQALTRGDLVLAGSRAEAGRAAARAADQPAWEWTFRVIQAEVLVSQRKNDEVMALLDDGLARHPAVAPVRVRALMARAMAWCRSADGDTARRRATADLDEAERAAEELGSEELVGEIALRRGSCLVHEGDLVGAEAQFRRAFAVASRRHLAFLESNAAGSLGLLRIKTERYDEATEWLQRALALAVSIGADTPRIKTLVNLGWCYSRLGDFDRALPILAEAEELATSRRLAGDQLLASILQGNALYAKRLLAQAGGHYQRALAVARELGDREATAQLLSNLGLLAFEQGRYAEAEELLGEALSVEKALGDEVGRLHTRLNQGHVWAARGRAAEAEAAYREVLAADPAPPEVKWEAGSGLAVLHVKAGRAAEAEAEFRDAFAAMERSRSRIAAAEHRISFFSALRRFHNEYVDFLVDGGRLEDALRVADQGRARLLSESLSRSESLGPASFAQARQLAAGLDAVILFYWTAPRRSFVWAITPADVAMRVLPGEEEIAGRIEAHQVRILRSRDLVGGDAPEEAWLYRALIEPIADRLGGAGRRVLLVPDGPLHQLNFETLVVPGERPRYWIEDVTTAVAPSLGLLGRRPPGGGVQPRSILLIGDPLPTSDEFPRLPHAGREVARIAALFEPSLVTARTQAEAVPSAYAAAGPGRFAFLHFAAHATANRESPFDSAVVLSGKAGPYKLYARDIAPISLGAELVTLSACRSAGSRAYAGEGLVGLAWAFLGSGARNVVGGLWNVEDASTAELMETLYAGILRDELDPPAALRAAKLRLLRSGTAHRKPFYWAPFVLYTRG